jgi:uncharacterized oxidoreductase
MTAIPANKLKIFASELLAKGGFTTDEAKTIADSLTLSELMGHSSHGLIRVEEYLLDLKKGNTVSGAELRIINDTPSSIIADAQLGAGQVVMPKLLEKLQEKLKSQAVVSAAVRNSGHTGRIGEWAEIPAKAGYPSLLFVNDNGNFFTVAPPGGKKSVTSTNPMAFAIPLENGEVFLTDMSTSAIAYGKVKVARLSGGTVPPGSIQDAEGNPTVDPEAIFSNPKGSLLPMGGTQGYKGFAISMFIDLLVAGLSGGQTPPGEQGTAYANNLTIVLWNPKFFAGLEHMKEQARKYLDFIHACSPIDPARPVRIPGDRMNKVRKEREAKGITLSKGLSESLVSLANSLGVTPLSELTN